jgi:hypothetical protein
MRSLANSNRLGNGGLTPGKSCGIDGNREIGDREIGEIGDREIGEIGDRRGNRGQEIGDRKSGTGIGESGNRGQGIGDRNRGTGIEESGTRNRGIGGIGDGIGESGGNQGGIGRNRGQTGRFRSRNKAYRKLPTAVCRKSVVFRVRGAGLDFTSVGTYRAVARPYTNVVFDHQISAHPQSYYQLAPHKHAIRIITM